MLCQLFNSVRLDGSAGSQKYRWSFQSQIPLVNLLATKFHHCIFYKSDHKFTFYSYDGTLFVFACAGEDLSSSCLSLRIA